MKMIHCADLHLDSSMVTNLSAEQARERTMELLFTFQRMVAYAEEQKVKAILIAGDLFDSKKVSVVTQNGVRDAILFHPSIDFLYVRGNHDSRSVLFDEEERPENFKVFGEEWSTYSYGSVTVSGVNESGMKLVSAEELELQADKVNIVMLHGQVTEYIREEGRDWISLKEYRNKPIDYMALGHIHQYHKESLNERGSYCYSGCLEGRGYDECGEKGFVLLDIEEQERTVISTFVPFAKRNLHILEVNIEDCMTSFGIARKIDSVLTEEMLPEKDLVKIHLVGGLDVECEKNMTFLREKYQDIFYDFKIEDKTTPFVDYGDYILEETLKGEFVRLVQQADLQEEEKAEIIRCGILALAGEEFVECD